MSLENPIVQENAKKNNGGGMSKGYRSQPESAPSGLRNNNLNNKISCIDYNPKYKISICGSILTYI